MSNSKEFSGDRSSGPRPNTVAETCNLLSQYLKERRNFGGVGLELARKLKPKGREIYNSTSHSKTLTDNMENSAEKPAKHGLMDLFPQQAGVTNAISSKQAIVESETALMTIFYGGKLFVFDNFPVEKVKDLKVLAMQKSQVKAVENDLPIMRKASLHRFVKERKDRAVARAPYQVHGGPSASSSKHEANLSLKL